MANLINIGRRAIQTVATRGGIATLGATTSLLAGAHNVGEVAVGAVAASIAREAGSLGYKTGRASRQLLHDTLENRAAKQVVNTVKKVDENPSLLQKIRNRFKTENITEQSLTPTQTELVETFDTASKL